MRRGLRITLVLAGGLFLVVLVSVAAFVHVQSADVAQDQQQLDPFYVVESDQIPGVPGSVVRSEPLAVKLTNVTAYRVVYRTRSSEGTPRVSGAMILVPTAKAPADGRKIVAWAHPTLGMGDACAPSRSADTLLDMGFAQEMINNGWVITATDYAGVGTQGTGRYLVGQDEANDVAYSVAMAHGFPGAEAGKTWAVYGHSQGGHSALWTGELGGAILPDFSLVGTAAVAPAAGTRELRESRAGLHCRGRARGSHPCRVRSESVHKGPARGSCMAHDRAGTDAAAHAIHNADIHRPRNW